MPNWAAWDVGHVNYPLYSNLFCWKLVSYDGNESYWWWPCWDKNEQLNENQKYHQKRTADSGAEEECIYCEKVFVKGLGFCRVKLVPDQNMTYKNISKFIWNHQNILIMAGTYFCICFCGSFLCHEVLFVQLDGLFKYSDSIRKLGKYEYVIIPIWRRFNGTSLPQQLQENVEFKLSSGSNSSWNCTRPLGNQEGTPFAPKVMNAWLPKMCSISFCIILKM